MSEKRQPPPPNRSEHAKNQFSGNHQRNLSIVKVSSLIESVGTPETTWASDRRQPNTTCETYMLLRLTNLRTRVEADETDLPARAAAATGLHTEAFRSLENLAKESRRTPAGIVAVRLHAAVGCPRRNEDTNARRHPS